MEIYKSELSIKDKVLASKTVGICIPIEVTEDKSDLLINSLENIKKNGCSASLTKALARITKGTHPELMYGSAILASTVMNKNDDVFLPQETWQARSTPINTPFNDDHIDV